MRGTPRVFRFRPAPLRQGEEYRLEGSHLHGPEGMCLTLDEVTSAGFVRHKLRRQIFLRFDLATGSGTRQLSYSAPATADWTAQPGARDYIALVAALCDGLAGERPGLQVTYGEGGKPRVVMFAIGVLSATAGIGLFALALASGVAGEKLVAGAVPAGLMLALGTVIALAYAPWRALPRIPAGRMRGMLELMARPGGTE